MAALSYTLYDYADVDPTAIGVTPTVTYTDALLTLTTNGPFPTGEPGGNPAGGVLYVTIDGFYIGQLFDIAPGPAAQGYFVPRGDDLPYGTAVIPQTIWQSIIADGEVQIEYAYGTDPGVLAGPDDYIRVDVDWYESRSQYSGSPGDDYLMTNGPSLILGLDGNDIIMGDRYNDTIHGGDGNDNIDGGDGDDTIRGNDGRDLAFGGDGNDYVGGDAGNDELSGGDGDDDVVGGSGNDVLYGDDGIDTIRGGDGLDNLIGGRGDDVLWGGADRDYLLGDDGTDRLRGEAGNDDLDGGNGDDYLWGGAGDDRVWGGRGDNHLWGGDGADQFMFNATDQAGTQHVYDFDRSEGDRLMYFQAFDQVIDDYDIRVGKDGTVVTIADTTIVLSGVFDLTPADITFLTDADWPWF